MFFHAAGGWSAEEQRKARAALQASIAYGAITCASCVAAIKVAPHSWTLVPSSAIGLLALFGNPWLLKVTRRPLIAGQLLTVEMLVGIAYTAITNGGTTPHGLESASAPWLLVVPVLAALLVGSTFACFAAAACALQALVMWLLFRFGVSFPLANAGEGALSSAWSTMTAIAFLFAFALITERNRAAATAARDAIASELLEAQKLEAVGRLAAGVAHEINTPVQFVSDHIHFVAGAIADGDPEAMKDVPAALTRSLEGLDRVTAIIKAMRAFARADAQAKAPVDLNSAVQSTLTISKAEYKLVADVTTDFGELPPVTCHAGQINQVLLNLICNAAQAIADRVQGTEAKGHIAVKTSRDGGEAVIAITDTGGGIPADVRAKIFEPFFTTKAVGRGTGQGLSVARGYVLGHQGRLTFETEVGVGTTFFLRLPFAASAA